MEKEIRPVMYAGMFTLLSTGLLDVSPLEGREGVAGFLGSIQMKKGRYYCHYAVSDDAQRITAIMVVHADYPGDSLETSEFIGYTQSALSGVVGFFSHPKKAYTLNQLGEYVAQLEKEHSGRCWVNINSKQFFAPSSQGLSTRVPVYGHRDKKGELDALQIEFDPRESELLQTAIAEVALNG